MRRFVLVSLLAGALGAGVLAAPAHAEKVCYVDGPCYCSHDRVVAGHFIRYYLPC